MLIIRLYSSAYSNFFALSFDTGSSGILQAIVVTCASVPDSRHTKRCRRHNAP